MSFLIFGNNLKLIIKQLREHKEHTYDDVKIESQIG
jgi:hypothetical protein